MQIINALRQAGHKVTASTPLYNFIGKENAARVRTHLTPEELWASENYHDPEAVLNRFQPDIAITCNINTFRTIRRFSRDIVQIVDCNGPLQFEGLLGDSADVASAMADHTLLESRCRRLVEQLRDVDYLITVSERQKYFWIAYCSMAGFSFNELDVFVCPSTVDYPTVSRDTAPQLTVVHSGGFYPWQNPDRGLRLTAEILETIPGAKLHIFGAPHPGLPNEKAVLQMLDDLRRFRSVEYHGYRPIEELTSTLATAWCALELMERNVERELAITGRTVGFLSAGTPVVYNDYSTLSKLIRDYNAGWTISLDHAATALRSIFESLVSGGPAFVEELSNNARRLAACEFSSQRSMAPLVEFCDKPVSKRRGRHSRPTVALQAGSKSLGRVLAISPGLGGPLGELRVANPLRSLQRLAHIDAATLVAPWSFESLRNDKNTYDVILTQRAIPEWIYHLLNGMSLRFALDVDDNMLAVASYRHDPVESEILLGLASCATLTVPNPRLVRALEHYSGLSLAAKTFVTPNALPFGDNSSKSGPSQPSQLVWIQSDIAALDRSRANVVRAVEDFSRKHSLPVVLIGKNVLHRPSFTYQKVLGELDFSANLQFLEFSPTSIGIAPLETDADRQTLDFVAGKSDLKILLFAGYGHAGVYSAAPPYTDSPLQDGLSVVKNSYEEWRDALEWQHTEAWRHTADISARIRSERHIDQVANQSWLPALQASALSRSVRGTDLYEAFRGASRMDDSPVRSIAYLLANRDIMEHALSDGNFNGWKHYVQFGVNEHRRLIHHAEAYNAFLTNLENHQKHLAENDRIEIENLRNRVKLLEGELTAAQATISGVLQSKSWKLTAPLRSLSHRLK